MATQLTDQDIFVSDTNPTPTVNPKVVGSIWVNYSTSKMYVCSNNRKNANIWNLINPDNSMTFDSNWHFEYNKLLNDGFRNIIYTNTSKYPWYVWLYNGSSEYFYNYYLYKIGEPASRYGIRRGNNFLLPPQYSFYVPLTGWFKKVNKCDILKRS